MVRITRAISFVLAFGAAFLLRLPGQALAGQEEEITIYGEILAGKRFRFSWSSDNVHGVNGIALLEDDGSIAGISSPNESTWLIDETGRLLFKHADGRVSTQFEEARLEEGLLCFKGPFLLREGITHHLIEVEGTASKREHRMTPELTAKVKYSTQRFLYLDPGETGVFRLKDGTERQIRLVSVKEYADAVIGLNRRADVRIEIDDTPLELTCAPFVMPTETQGLRIQADTTSAWLAIPKRVQFSLWDVTDPIVDTEQFCIPLPGYGLFSQGMQGYNEPVHLGHRDGDPVGQRFYHNYGVDLAGYEGRQKVVSCIDGVVVQVDRAEGDLAVQDDRGFILYYGHLDSILPAVRVGTPVRRGQWVGMLGKRGASGNFSHLHVGTYASKTALAAGRLNRNLNLYPWLVAAYQAETGTDLYAVARPHKTARTGDTVLFDGSNSMAFRSDIISFRWEFHDGTSASGHRAEKVYERPGCHMAALWIEDSRGKMDVDFCKIKVYSRSAPEDVIPTLFMTYTPSREVHVDQPVSFRLWPQGMGVEGIRLDFGDGRVVEGYRAYLAVAHAFKVPGIYVVTATGAAGQLPVTQKVKVLVQE